MKKKIIIFISLILIIFVMGGVLFFMQKDDTNIVIYTDDEIKFKDEFENLNGIELTEGNVLKTLDIESDNNVKYLYDDNIIDALTNGTKVILVGSSTDNRTRTVLPILLKSLKANSISELYYYDCTELKNAYLNIDSNKSGIYENIINIIGEDINTLFSEESRLGLKEIVLPTVVFIKNNQYKSLYSGSLETQINDYDDLSIEQQKELSNIYQSKLDLINQNVCTEDEC